MRPNNIPSGYALVSDPKDAPVGNWKCLPMVGVSGDVIVNPSKLSVVAVRIARMEVVVFFDIVWYFFLFSFGDEEEMGDDEWSLVLELQ